jgi:hypothetical protein
MVDKINWDNVENQVNLFKKLNLKQSKLGLNKNEAEDYYNLIVNLKDFSLRLIIDSKLGYLLNYGPLLEDFMQVVLAPKGRLVALNPDAFLFVENFGPFGKVQKIFYKLNSGKWLQIAIRINNLIVLKNLGN